MKTDKLSLKGINVVKRAEMRKIMVGGGFTCN